MKNKIKKKRQQHGMDAVVSLVYHRLGMIALSLSEDHVLHFAENHNCGYEFEIVDNDKLENQIQIHVYPAGWPKNKISYFIHLILKKDGGEWQAIGGELFAPARFLDMKYYAMSFMCKNFILHDLIIVPVVTEGSRNDYELPERKKEFLEAQRSLYSRSVKALEAIEKE